MLGGALFDFTGDYAILLLAVIAMALSGVAIISRRYTSAGGNTIVPDNRRTYAAGFQQ